MGSQWKVAAPDLYGCTLWLGKLDRDGYGVVFTGKGRPSMAHRMAWEGERGPIPAGMELEHSCRRRSCVRLAHLLLVDHRTNIRLKRWRTRVAVKLCPKGHDLWLDGMITPEGGRICRTCSRH